MGKLVANVLILVNRSGTQAASHSGLVKELGKKAAEDELLLAFAGVDKGFVSATSSIRTTDTVLLACIKAVLHIVRKTFDKKEIMSGKTQSLKAVKKLVEKTQTAELPRLSDLIERDQATAVTFLATLGALMIKPLLVLLNEFHPENAKASKAMTSFMQRVSDESKQKLTDVAGKNAKSTTAVSFLGRIKSIVEGFVTETQIVFLTEAWNTLELSSNVDNSARLIPGTENWKAVMDTGKQPEASNKQPSSKQDNSEAANKKPKKSKAKKSKAKEKSKSKDKDIHTAKDKTSDVSKDNNIDAADVKDVNAAKDKASDGPNPPEAPLIPIKTSSGTINAKVTDAPKPAKVPHGTIKTTSGTIPFKELPCYKHDPKKFIVSCQFHGVDCKVGHNRSTIGVRFGDEIACQNKQIVNTPSNGLRCAINAMIGSMAWMVRDKSQGEIDPVVFYSEFRQRMFKMTETDRWKSLMGSLDANTNLAPDQCATLLREFWTYIRPTSEPLKYLKEPLFGGLVDMRDEKGKLLFHELFVMCSLEQVNELEKHDVVWVHNTNFTMYGTFDGFDHWEVIGPRDAYQLGKESD